MCFALMEKHPLTVSPNNTRARRHVVSSDTGIYPRTREASRSLPASVQRLPQVYWSCAVSGRVKPNVSAPVSRPERFNELQHDVLHNQILRTTIDRFRHAEGLDRELNHELGQLLKAFEHVFPIAVTRNSFRRLKLHRNNGYNNLLMKVCELYPKGGPGGSASTMCCATKGGWLWSSRNSFATFIVSNSSNTMSAGIGSYGT